MLEDKVLFEIDFGPEYVSECEFKTHIGILYSLHGYPCENYYAGISM